ncbi:MAG: hypothetical protein MJ093_02260 [Saccharofermentans sp.]|nr:hypothetical protein [Saccharofermentans sp.]
MDRRSDINFVSNNKIAETSSKGNQEKWFDNNRWYKLDQFGYEALSEVFTTYLLERSNIEKNTSFTFVRYEMEKMNVHKLNRTGCSSENFLKPGESIITINKLFKEYYNRPLKGILMTLSSDKKRISFLAEKVAEITGLKEFPLYLTIIFELDALVLNNDRHLNNIAVIKKENGFDYCPIFDNGAGLLSNAHVLPLDITPEGLMKTVDANPFHISFNRQLNIIRSLYGSQLEIPRLTKDEIDKVLLPLLEYYPERDRGIIRERVTKTIIERQKY